MTVGAGDRAELNTSAVHVEPRVVVRRKPGRGQNDVAARAPVDAVGGDRETERGVLHERDVVGLRPDEPRNLIANSLDIVAPSEIEPRRRVRNGVLLHRVGSPEGDRPD